MQRVGAAPCRVRVEAALDRAGQAVLVALPEKGTADMADDPKLREMTCDPRFRKVLVTDGKTAVGPGDRAGAGRGRAPSMVWVGECRALEEARRASRRCASCRRRRWFRSTSPTAARCSELAGEIGGKVDILINTAECIAPSAIAARRGVETAQLEMEVNYFGLLRLAQAFGPVLKARAADGPTSAVAWVNLLSIFALSNFPPHGTYSASKAAALSLSQACAPRCGRPASA